MQLSQSEREAVEDAIRSAFTGVRLGSGVSLRQARAMDDYLEGLTEADFAALPRSEVTDDWTRIPETELVNGLTSYMDADGLRYYLPALMLWLLDHYDDKAAWLPDPAVASTVIGTVGALAPGKEFRERQFRMFEDFSAEQKGAIASYLHALPNLVSLDSEDATLVARSLNHSWGRHLKPPP